MKQMKLVCALFACSLIFFGCANQEKSVEKSIEDTTEKAKDTMDDAVNESEKNIEDLMQYLKEAQNGIDQEEVIEDIPFAAYEGRSFLANGKQMYLYYIDTADADMQRLAQQLQADSIVNVERNGQKMQYKGMLDGDYLLLYDLDTDASALEEAIHQYLK